jgi:uracil phosphoribosyltransferase
MALPSNIYVSSHPCLQAKLSQLRSHSTSPRETRSLVHDIATILGVEAFAAGLKVSSGEKVVILPDQELQDCKTI